jgi:hypothetical protein
VFRIAELCHTFQKTRINLLLPTCAVSGLRKPTATPSGPMEVCNHVSVNRNPADQLDETKPFVRPKLLTLNMRLKAKGSVRSLPVVGDLIL